MTTLVVSGNRISLVSRPFGVSFEIRASFRCQREGCHATEAIFVGVPQGDPIDLSKFTLPRGWKVLDNDLICPNHSVVVFDGQQAPPVPPKDKQREMDPAGRY